MEKREVPKGIKEIAIQFVGFIEEVDKSKNSPVNNPSSSTDKINK